MTHRRLPPCLFLILLGLAPVGCGPREIDTTYGRTRGQSINGTGTFAEMLRQDGHEVRTAIRATETLGEWANVLVRFANYPGPPDRDEAKWMLDWLKAMPGRKVVYIPRDFTTEPEFWAAMLAALPQGAPPEIVRRLEKRRDFSKPWVGELPAKAKNQANADDWFGVPAKTPSPSTCKTLGGPWAEGVDAQAAAILKHEVFTAQDEEVVLLSGDDQSLVLGWTLDNGGSVLAVANGSFLLNAALLNRARRPLANRVLSWVGAGPTRVAFLEGERLLEGKEAPSSSPLRLFTVPPFGWVVAHLAFFGLLFCLALATTLGRPRSEAPSEIEHPSAHPKALGALLARTGRDDVARFLLESYRRWRHPASRSASASASASTSNPAPTLPPSPTPPLVEFPVP